jgi:hypothetical protein
MAWTGSTHRVRSPWRTAATVVTATVTFGLLAVTGLAGTAASGGDPAPAAFRLADGSAGCNFLESGEIACRAAESPSALVLTGDGDVRAADVPVSWGDETPVLQAAESWWHGDFSCSVEEGRLECASASGGVIAVGHDGEAGAIPPASSTQG